MVESEQKEIFTVWLREHRGIIFKIIRAYAFTPHDQEDLFQEISLQLWQSIPEFRGEAKVSTWIYRVSLYSATAWIRKEKKRLPTQMLSGLEQTLIITSEPRNERLDWLYEQITQPNPIDRSLCVLMLEGFSYKEMAELLGISESNVGVKIHRIKKYLVSKSQEKIQDGV